MASSRLLQRISGVAQPMMSVPSGSSGKCAKSKEGPETPVLLPGFGREVAEDSDIYCQNLARGNDKTDLTKDMIGER